MSHSIHSPYSDFRIPLPIQQNQPQNLSLFSFKWPIIGVLMMQNEITIKLRLMPFNLLSYDGFPAFP